MIRSRSKLSGSSVVPADLVRVQGRSPAAEAVYNRQGSMRCRCCFPVQSRNRQCALQGPCTYTCPGISSHSGAVALCKFSRALQVSNCSEAMSEVHRLQAQQGSSATQCATWTAEHMHIHMSRDQFAQRRICFVQVQPRIVSARAQLSHVCFHALQARTAITPSLIHI